MRDVIPATPYEQAFARGAQQQASLTEILGMFRNESLVVPSGVDTSKGSNSLQPGVGLVVNPGTTWGFEILPASVPSIINTFGPEH